LLKCYLHREACPNIPKPKRFSPKVKYIHDSLLLACFIFSA
jgi:hypothetical protein